MIGNASLLDLTCPERELGLQALLPDTGGRYLPIAMLDAQYKDLPYGKVFLCIKAVLRVLGIAYSDFPGIIGFANAF